MSQTNSVHVKYTVMSNPLSIISEVPNFLSSYSKTNQTHNISNLFYFGTTLYMLRTVSPSIIRSLRLYIQHQVYVIQVLYDIYLMPHVQS